MWWVPTQKAIEALSKFFWYLGDCAWLLFLDGTACFLRGLGLGVGGTACFLCARATSPLGILVLGAGWWYRLVLCGMQGGPGEVGGLVTSQRPGEFSAH